MQIKKLILGDEIGWSEKNYRTLQCPFCAEGEYPNLADYNHIGIPELHEGKDGYEADWDGRGDLLVIPVSCESGHNWEICFGEHKGNVSVFTRNKVEVKIQEGN